MTRTDPCGPISRRERRAATGIAIGTAVFLGTAALARRPLSRAEVGVFRAANDLPGEAYPAVWVPMQYGTFGTVPASTAISAARGRSRLALALGVAGTAAWLLVKVAKPIVGRGRPSSLVEGTARRGAKTDDRGFPSGHAAVSTALTVAAWPHLATRGRARLVVLAGFVSFARMYVGAHLPLDVIGGSAFGLAIGSAVDLALARRDT